MSNSHGSDPKTQKRWARGRPALRAVLILVLFGSMGTPAWAQLGASRNQIFYQDWLAEQEHFGHALETGDFDCDGIDDLAVGAPGDRVLNMTEAAGAVTVLYGTPKGGLNTTGMQHWYPGRKDIDGSSTSGDAFGFALASGDFNGDACDDLAIGAPGWGPIDAGLVWVLYGSPTVGLVSIDHQLFGQGLPASMYDVPEELDNFGWALAAGDFDGNGFDDLAIGVPNEGLGNKEKCGAVHVVYGTSGGLSAAGNQFWEQGSSGIKSDRGRQDRFGWSLVAGDFDGDNYYDLAVGAPWESVGQPFNQTFAGAVNVIYGGSSGLSASGDEYWHQNKSGIADSSESGDLFGWALAAADFDANGVDDLAIGVPFESWTGVSDGGVAHVLSGSSTGLSGSTSTFWHQNLSWLIDISETGDCFGFSMAAGDFDGNGSDDLALGVSGETVESIPEGGVAHIIYSMPSVGLTYIQLPDQVWYQNSPGIEGATEPDDRFGYSLAAGDFNGDGVDDLAIGTPFETITQGAFTFFEAGAVNVLYGN